MSRKLLYACLLLELISITYVYAANFECVSNGTVLACPNGCYWNGGASAVWKCRKTLGDGTVPSFPADLTTKAILNTTRTYVISDQILNADRLDMGALTLGYYGTTSTPPTVNISGAISFYPTPLSITNQGIVNLMLTGGYEFHSQSSPSMSDKNAVFNWYGGILTGSDYPFNITAGTLNVWPSAELIQANRRILIGSGATLNIRDGSTFVLGPDSVINVANGGNFIFIGNSTITTDIGGRLVCNGTLKLNPGVANTANLNINFLTNQSLETQNGNLKLGANATLSNINNGNGFTIFFNGQTASTGNLTNNGFIYWTSGSLKIQAGSSWTNNVGAKITLSGTTFSYGGRDVSTLVNYGTLVINNTIAFRAINVVNAGADSVMQVESTFTASTMTINGTSIISNTGAGSIVQNVGTFTWSSGSITVPIRVTPQVDSAILTGADEKILSNVILTLGCKSTFSGKVSVYESIDSPVVPGILNQAGATMYANGASMYTGEAQSYGEFKNEGTLYGTISFKDGVDLVSNGQIGSNFGYSNPITVISIDKGNLVLSDTSKIYLDVYSGRESKISVTGTGTIQAAGTLVVRLRRDYIAYSATTLNVLSYPSGGFNGSFSSLQLDTTTDSWGNPGLCASASILQDSTKNLIKVTFSGCNSAPTPNVDKHTSSNSTIVIVVVVVFVIAVIVGTIAWCKKKYRKRPWDRLRGDRL